MTVRKLWYSFNNGQTFDFVWGDFLLICDVAHAISQKHGLMSTVNQQQEVGLLIGTHTHLKPDERVERVLPESYSLDPHLAASRFLHVRVLPCASSSPLEVFGSSDVATTGTGVRMPTYRFTQSRDCGNRFEHATSSRGDPYRPSAPQFFSPRPATAPLLGGSGAGTGRSRGLYTPLLAAEVRHARSELPPSIGGGGSLSTSSAFTEQLRHQPWVSSSSETQSSLLPQPPPSLRSAKQTTPTLLSSSSSAAALTSRIAVNVKERGSQCTVFELQEVSVRSGLTVASPLSSGHQLLATVVHFKDGDEEDDFRESRDLCEDGGPSRSPGKKGSDAVGTLCQLNEQYQRFAARYHCLLRSALYWDDDFADYVLVTARTVAAARRATTVRLLVTRCDAPDAATSAHPPSEPPPSRVFHRDAAVPSSTTELHFVASAPTPLSERTTRPAAPPARPPAPPKFGPPSVSTTTTTPSAVLSPQILSQLEAQWRVLETQLDVLVATRLAEERRREGARVAAASGDDVAQSALAAMLRLADEVRESKGMSQALLDAATLDQRHAVAARVAEEAVEAFVSANRLLFADASVPRNELALRRRWVLRRVLDVLIDNTEFCRAVDLCPPPLGRDATPPQPVAPTQAAQRQVPGSSQSDDDSSATTRAALRRLIAQESVARHLMETDVWFGTWRTLNALFEAEMLTSEEACSRERFALIERTVFADLKRDAAASRDAAQQKCVARVAAEARMRNEAEKLEQLRLAAAAAAEAEFQRLLEREESIRRAAREAADRVRREAEAMKQHLDAERQKLFDDEQSVREAVIAAGEQTELLRIVSEMMADLEQIVVAAQTSPNRALNVGAESSENDDDVSRLSLTPLFATPDNLARRSADEIDDVELPQPIAVQFALAELEQRPTATTPSSKAQRATGETRRVPGVRATLVDAAPLSSQPSPTNRRSQSRAESESTFSIEDDLLSPDSPDFHAAGSPMGEATSTKAVARTLARAAIDQYLTRLPAAAA